MCNPSRVSFSPLLSNARGYQTKTSRLSAGIFCKSKMLFRHFPVLLLRFGVYSILHIIFLISYISYYIFILLLIILRSILYYGAYFGYHLKGKVLKPGEQIISWSALPLDLSKSPALPNKTTWESPTPPYK